MSLNEVLALHLGTISLEKVLTAVLMGVCGVIITRIITCIVKKVLKRTTLDKSLQSVIAVVLRIVMYTIVVLIVADFFGIPITSLLTALSIVGLAVSLAIQDTLSNVFGGMILLVSKIFTSGEYVQVNGLEGTIVKVDLMNTHLLTFDNKHVRIPNKDVQAAPIVNYSREPIRRVDLIVGVSYDSDTKTVKDALLKTAKNADLILDEPAPFTGLYAYGENRIEFKLQGWANTPDYWPAYYQLTEGVRESLKEAGVSMTYNHINVHMHPDQKED
ncbi:MAG: mechanosensitive ion channel family protein [Clostridia bacterium]|nr:mechanosensitive ion channel family protein [Clostridia bacterium]